MKLTLVRGTCNDGKTCPGLYRTERGTYVVRGYVVDDAEALAELDLPAGETAVEVPAELLRQVDEAC